MGKSDFNVVDVLKWATEYRDNFQKQSTKERGYRRYRQPEAPMEKLFNQFLEDQLRLKFKEMDEKLNKKDEKKEVSWWDKQSFIQKIAVLTMTVPISMMALTLLVLEFVSIIRHINL